MRKQHLIHESELKISDLKYWEGQSLNSYYNKLKGFLSQRLGNDYIDFLATPQIKKNNKGEETIKWLVYSEKEKINAFAQSVELNRVEMANERLAEIKQLSETLAKSKNKEDKHWAKLLQHTFSNASYSDFFTDGEKLFLVNWSLNTLPNTNKGSFSIDYPIPPDPTPDKKGAKKNIATTDKKEDIPPTVPSPDPLPLPTQKESVEEDQGNEKETIPTIDDSQSNEKKETPEIESTEENEDLASPKIDKPTEEENEIEEIEEIEEFDKSNDEISDGDAVPADAEDETSILDEAENEQPKATHTPHSRAKFTWLFLLILLVFILAIVFFFKTCSLAKGGGSGLPNFPLIIPPIDSTEVGYNEDSIAQIVTNRLNIIITSEQTIEEFAKDFKKHYPDERYKILYYGVKEIKRILIQVPEEERAILVTQIPEKFPQYKLLVFEEGLLKIDARPSESGFSDRNKSWYFEKIKAYAAWNESWGDQQIIVAVIDDGFDLNHLELKGKIVHPFNVLSGDSNNMMSGTVGKHGTHVAGTAVGARDNKAGLSGIAPDCTLMPIRVAANNGFMPQSAIVDAILYAINQGADVINLSLGMSIHPSITALPVGVQQDIVENSFKNQEAFWMKLFAIADQHKVSVVIAAGNQNVLVGLDPMSRTPYTINVSATNENDDKLSFSNFGKASTISAPGTKIYNSTPNNDYKFMDGTSMACPMVTGAVALLKSINPSLSNDEIKHVLVTTGKQLSNHIGPLLQLDKALGSVDSSGVNLPEDQCENVSAKIDSLLEEIERLKNICPDENRKDTMSIPKVINDLGFSHGTWESTKDLNNNSNEKVKVRFVFNKDNTGTIYFLEKNGLECTSPLGLSHTPNTFDINQLHKAQCSDQQKQYYTYEFSCSADAQNKASCIAQNKTVKANKFKFSLIKIK